MNTPSLTTETDNLVLFPSSKNFPLENKETMAGILDEKLDDPMMDLLTEFSTLNDEDLINFEVSESLLEDEIVYGSLEAFMTRKQVTETLSEDDKIALMIDERMGQIHEARERIKFYLDELEMFLPRRR